MAQPTDVVVRVPADAAPYVRAALVRALRHQRLEPAENRDPRWAVAVEGVVAQLPADDLARASLAALPVGR